MVIMAALGGIGTAFIDLTDMSEEEKRIAKASIWASAAAIGGATGIDSGSVAVGAAMAAKEIAGLVIKDDQVMQIVDASASVVSGAAAGNYAEMAKVVGTAAVGAGVGAAAGGVDGIDDGMRLGAQLGAGDGMSVVSKAAGGAIGAGVGAAATKGDASKVDNMLAGAKLGMSVGGAAASAGTTVDSIEEQRQLMPDAPTGPVTDQAVNTARFNGAVQLAGLAAGASVGATEEKKGKSAFEMASMRASTGSSIASGANGVGQQLRQDIATPETGTPDAAAPTASGAPSEPKGPDATAHDDTSSATGQDASKETDSELNLPGWAKSTLHYSGSTSGIAGTVASLVIEKTYARTVERMQREHALGYRGKQSVEVAKTRLKRAEALTEMANSAAELRSA